MFMKDSICVDSPQTDLCVYARVLSHFSHVQLFDPIDCRLLLSMGFSRQEYWSGLPMPSSRGSSQPMDGIQVSHIACTFFTIQATREAHEYWSG